MPLRTSISALVFLALAGLCDAALAGRDALWKIVDTRCVPENLAGKAAGTCARVELSPDRDHGWVVLKDLRGDLQYLLMPTARIAGTESPELWDPASPNYFALAWRSRDLLDRLHGQPLPRDAVSLTVNSMNRRSQDQMHIHISCVQPELRARLLAAQDEIGGAWAPLRGGWLGHAWQLRRVEAPMLDAVNPFADVAANVPEFSADKGHVTVAAVGVNFRDGREGFVLMASLMNPDDRSSGSAEEDVQDHDCRILGQTVLVPR